MSCPTEIVVDEAATSTVELPADDQITVEPSVPAEHIAIERDDAPTVVELHETVLELTTVDSADTVVVETLGGTRGAQGQQGIPGPPGPPGLDSGTYIHHQGDASDLWVINHGLGFYPGGIVVKSSAGDVVIGDLRFPNPDTVEVAFTAALAGRAFVS